AINDANEGEDDQMSISYDEDRDAFLIHAPNYPDGGPEVMPDYEITVDGWRRPVYALGTRAWTWNPADDRCLAAEVPLCPYEGQQWRLSGMIFAITGEGQPGGEW